jgi:hypothetical protein
MKGGEVVSPVSAHSVPTLIGEMKFSIEQTERSMAPVDSGEPGFAI